MRPLFLAMSLAFALPLLVVAQETTGGVRGRLRSGAGGPVPTALVTATSPDLLGERRARSAADGVFQFGLLPPGTYTLRVTAIGHRALVIRDVAVRLGRITGLGDVALETAAIELGEVTITAPPMTLDPVRTTVGATLTAEDYALLPVERDYRSAIAILPHVNTSVHGDPVNVGGSTGLENTYFIDGMNVTSPLSAAAATTLPYNFVRAVEVKAGGYEAQYGKALGAVVNAITYTGTNEFEGQVFGFLTHDALTGEPRALPVLRETGAASYDIGARASGPVVRDRLWFSAAYNPRINRVDQEIPTHGVYTDETTAHIFAGKLTWRATTRTTLVVSLFGDPTTRHLVAPVEGRPTLAAVNPDPFLRRLESGAVTTSLQSTTTLGPRVVIDGGLSYTRGRESTLAETAAGSTERQYQDLVAGTVGGGVNATSDVSQGRGTALLRSMLSAGRHAIVGGFEYEDAQVSRTLGNPGGALIQRSDDTTWKTFEDRMTGKFHSRVATAYLQDAMRLTDRLTVSAGLRWSGQFLTGASGSIAQRFPDEWQPRLGFSWQLGPQATRRVFGSYGRFYQQSPLNIATLWYVDFVSIISSYSTDPRQPGAIAYDTIDGTTYEEDWAQSIDRLAVENFDEFTVGYDHLVGQTHRLTVRGIRRDLRSSFQFGFDASLPQLWVLGTPGKGSFAFLPPPRREYTALEVSVDGTLGSLNYRASYVLSRTWGNYTGLYMSDFDVANPGANWTFFMPEQAANSTGLLPNDRPHVLKLTGAYRRGRALGMGAFLTIASGIPRNDFGTESQVQAFPVFLAPRGSVGRTPAVWDLNLRLTYELLRPGPVNARMVLDLLHVGSPRETLQVDERHYYAPLRSSPNPDYLRPTAYQAPMMARVGMEVTF